LKDEYVYSPERKTLQEEHTTQRKKRNFRDKFRYSTPMPAKEVIVTTYIIKLNEKIPSFGMAIFMKFLNEQIDIQKEKHYEAIKPDEYTKNRTWRSTIPKQIRKTHYNRNDFIASAKAQHILNQK
jgi:hypothetical protein